MATTAYAGDTWVFDTTLTDSSGTPITALSDSWLSFYEGKTDEKFSYTSADSEVSLSSNTLTCVVPASVTTAIAAGTYYLDVKIKETGGVVSTVTDRLRVRVLSSSPLYDNY